MGLIEYETTVVIRPDIGGDAVEVLLDKVREVIKAGGKLLAIDHWGKKKLAYEIAKHARGIYVRLHYLGQSTLVLELERNLRISDQVLRFLSIRLAVNVGETEREEREYVRPQYDVDDPADNDNEPEFGGDREGGRYGDDRGDRDRDRDGPRGDRDGPRGDRDGSRGDRDGPRGDRGERDDREAGERRGARDRDAVPARAESEEV